MLDEQLQICVGISWKLDDYHIGLTGKGLIYVVENYIKVTPITIDDHRVNIGPRLNKKMKI